MSDVFASERDFLMAHVVKGFTSLTPTGKVLAEDCWQYQGARGGYVEVIQREESDGEYRPVRLNKLFFMAFNGPIPKGHGVYRKCNNRLCVNPDHLVTWQRSAKQRAMDEAISYYGGPEMASEMREES